MEIIIVEDVPPAAKGLLCALRAQGIDAITRTKPDTTTKGALWILLWTHPDAEALRHCRELRECDGAVAILVLMPQMRPEDAVAALDAGADDVVLRTIDESELVARIRALSRRTMTVLPISGVMQARELHFEGMTEEAFLGVAPLDLTKRERELLRYFVCHQGEVQTRAMLLAGVWGTTRDPGTKLVEVQIRNLRQKLGVASKWLVTVRGEGYMLVTQRDDERLRKINLTFGRG